jgi:DNA polymerase III alpha subunit
MIKNGLLDDLQTILSSCSRGNSPVTVEYQGIEAKTRLGFGDQWRLKLDDQLLSELAGLLGTDKVELDYTQHIQRLN